MHDPAMAVGSTTGLPLTEHVPEPSGAFQLHAHRDAHVWTWAAAVAISGELRRDLLRRPRARLLVARPGVAIPVYEALSRAPLDWSRVDIGLTDERWLLPDDPDSVVASVRTHLARDRAAAARLESITAPGRRLEESVAVANAHAQLRPGVAVLGMGDDGHVAGLFADSPDYGRVRASQQAYASLDGSFSLGAAPWPRRITSTPAGLARAGVVVLLLRGGRQRELFETGMAASAARSVVAALRDAGARLQAHWMP
jgi:6-phosphogluconolactonase